MGRRGDGAAERLSPGDGEIEAELEFLVLAHRLLGRLDQVGVAPPLAVAAISTQPPLWALRRAFRQIA